MDPGFALGEGEACPGSSSSTPRPFHEALAAEQDRLRGFLRRIPRRPSVDLDDLVQESLARALRYQDRFDGGRALWPWLKRIALHVHLDQRPQTSRPRVSPLEGVEEPAASDPETLTNRDAVESLLSRLPGVERQVLERFHQRGDSVREIAMELALPEGTVKSHLHRARRRLAQDVNEDMFS